MTEKLALFVGDQLGPSVQVNMVQFSKLDDEWVNPTTRRASTSVTSVHN